ncbi:MAG TPA: hypothetical protein VK148_12420 [Xanthobacteraceae bacterium]|nr:hypothetical protein [Xanthobacteraceae bacterium]
MITPLPRAARDYVKAFDVTAIALTRDSHIVATRDPAGCSVAWWVEADQAGRVIQKAKTNGNDILAAARALDVVVTEHAVVVERALAAVRKIDADLAQAQRTGLLTEINGEYRRRRLAAAERGERFMRYADVQVRLRRALAETAAGGATTSLVTRILGS